MKKLLILIFNLGVFLSLFFSHSGVVLANEVTQGDSSVSENLKNLEAEVISIHEEGKKTFLDELVEFQVLEVKILRGERKGEVLSLEHSAAGLGAIGVDYQPYQIGDRVRISSQRDHEGQITYSLNGEIKWPGLLQLGVIFALVVLVVGKLWGALSIVGLAASFLVIFKLIIPLIIRGINPVLAAVLGSIIIIPTTFYISHGINKKTHIGVITTFVGLIITGFLAVYFVDATHLTGFASEEAGFLQIERQGSIDIRGLLLAGIIIGTLGILDDVTIGQASVVNQLRQANKKIGWWELFKQGMRVGQDHISSMVNTLVLVYSGSALPLLLLFFDSQKSFTDILEFELIAEEIVRMLVGSIGLVLAAPMATALAAWWFTHSQEKEI